MICRKSGCGVVVVWNFARDRRNRRYLIWRCSCSRLTVNDLVPFLSTNPLEECGFITERYTPGWLRDTRHDLANQITSHRAKIMTATARDKIVQEPTNPDTFFPPLITDGPAVVVTAANEVDPVMVAEGMTVYEVTTTLGSEEDGDCVVMATAVSALWKAVNDVTVSGGKVTLKLAQSFTNTKPRSMKISAMTCQTNTHSPLRLGRLPTSSPRKSSHLLESRIQRKHTCLIPMDGCKDN